MAVQFGTIRLNFCEEIRYAFFVMVRVRYAFSIMVRVQYVGKWFEFKIPDFSHIAPTFCMQRQRTAIKPRLNEWIEIADL